MESTGRGLGAMTLLMRRVGVVALLALVGWSAVKATVEYLGDDEAGAADRIRVGAGDVVVDDIVDTSGTANDSGATGTAGSGAADAAGQLTGESGSSGGGGDAAGAAGTEPVSTPAPTTTVPPPTTTLPDRSGPPTPDNPARVYIVGDSDAGTFGPYLKELLDGTGITTSELNYVVSSGLARPDFFDWRAELAEQLPAVNPDVVVVTYGGNDAQGLAERNGEFILTTPTESNRDEWIAEYADRAGEVMDLLLDGDRKVVWVGIPNDDNPEVTARMAIQDEAARLAASTRDVVFVDTWKRFSGRDGGWAEFVIDPRDGVGKDVRAADGFHLNTTGAEILAIDIAQAVAGELRELGANI